MRVDDMWVMDNVRALIADQGTTFSNFYAPFPLCCPARASILTGQNAHNHGVLDNEAPLGGFAALDGTSTVATWMQAAGYQTAFAGKYLNHFGEVQPVAAPPGWSDFHGIVGGGNYFDTRVFENGVANQYTGPYQTDLFADISSEIITRSAAGDAPFFLWSSFYAPHSGQPVESDDPVGMQTAAVAPRHHDAFAGLPLPHGPAFNEADVSDKPAHIRNLPLLTASTQLRMTEAYQQRLEALLALDEAVGKMMTALTATGELANTIVAFTNDNGFMLGEHRVHAGKTIPYEPSARLPLVIRGPGFPVGVTRDQLAALIDLAPTFVDVGQAEAGLPVDGVSLMPLAADPAVGLGRNLLVEAGPNVVGEPNFYAGVRTDQWLYIEYFTGETELYDMQQDPDQLQSLHADPAYAAVHTQLADILATLRDCAGPSCRGAPPAPDLSVSDVATPPSPVVQGGAFTATDTTANVGDATAAPSTTRFYLSADKARSPGDWLLTGGRDVPSLTPRTSTTGSTSVGVPANVAPATYYLLVCADDLMVVVEPTEANNCRSSSTALSVQASASPADLVVAAVANPPANAMTESAFSVTDTTSNIGAEAAGASTTRYYLSADQARNAGDRLLSGGRGVSSLAPGASGTGSRSVTVPANAAAGTYYLLACADDRLVIAESTETNNCLSSATTVNLALSQASKPDLVVTIFGEPPATVVQGGAFGVTDTTANVGKSAAGPSTTRYYLSADQARSTNDRLLSGGRALAGIVAGGSRPGGRTVTVPLNVVPGVYYLLACADDLLTVDEATETNNCRGSTGTVLITAK